MIRYRYINPEILFVGIPSTPGSFNRSVPFSNNKMFWYLLSDAGLQQNLTLHSREVGRRTLWPWLRDHTPIKNHRRKRN